jgi:glycosyltransferase involved in cell wall biosynthesis
MITDGNVEHSSSRIRALQYIPYLEEAGFIVKWLPRIPSKKNSSLTNRFFFAVQKRFFLARIFFAIAFSHYQILFIQRFFVPRWLLMYCKRKMKPIVFDFDDAIYISAIDNRAFEKTISSIRLSDLVISSCPVLHKFSLKYNSASVIITSAVDANAVLPSDSKNKILTIGWIGSKWTSKYLSIVEPVISRLSERYKLRLLLVGASDSLMFKCETERVKWSLEDEPLQLQKMDIGIMPLFDSEFEQAKGGFKLFQYMAAGKPVLASPVGINTDIVIHGVNGFLCADENDWYNYLCCLIEDETERIKMGKHGRDLLFEKYSLDVCAEKLIENLVKL